jgi:hemoglobin-like flavoprotein
MFESRPELLEVFSKFKGRDLDELRRAGLLRQHALRVMATIDKVITRLDEPSSLKQMLREVGGHHRVYKVPPDYLQVI